MEKNQFSVNLGCSPGAEPVWKDRPSFILDDNPYPVFSAREIVSSFLDSMNFSCSVERRGVKSFMYSVLKNQKNNKAIQFRYMNELLPPVTKIKTRKS